MTHNLFLLFGDVDYDPRVQKVMDISLSFGDSAIVDVSTKKSINIDEKYHLIRVLIHDKQRPLHRHLRFWAISVYHAWRLKPELIFAEDFFSAFPGWLAAKFSGAKLIYDAHELILPERGQRLRLRAAVWYQLERFVVSRSDLVIAANMERAELMQAHYRLERRPETLRNLPQLRQVSLEDKAWARAQYPFLQRREANDRLLIYQGDVSLSRGLGKFIDALDHLPENYRLVIVGEGPDLKRVREMATRHEKNGRFSALGRVDKKVLPWIIGNADIGIVTYPFQGLNNILCAPNKLFEYSMAGIGIISSNQPTILSIAGENSEIGFFDEKSTPKEISDIIMATTSKARINIDFQHEIDKESKSIKKNIQEILT